MKAAVGLRVVRGPHWELSDKRGDGGEGFVGTVVEVGGTKGSKLAENKVWVQWDSGIRRDHRAGQYGKYYDLYVFDSSPAGVFHANFACDSCYESPILGMRWRCLECDDYDLCTGCYMADEHNKHHRFERIDSSDSEGVPVGKRLGAAKIQAKGVFVGARVVRGFDWNWDNQDGGKGKEGVVLEVTEHEKIPHSGAVVSWDCGDKNNYRIGFQGKVDLKCVTPGVGGHYYKDHLQRLGEVPQRKKGIPKSGKAKTSPNETLQGITKLQVGDNVRVTLPIDVVKCMSEIDGGAGWHDEMKTYLGKLGKVERVGKTVEIKYDDGAIWGFHPDAVKKDEVLETAHRRKRAMAEDDYQKKNKTDAKPETKPGTKPGTKPEAKPKPKPKTTGTDSAGNEVISVKPGLLVKVMNDEEIVKNIQEACGLMWNTEVSECVGKVGEVRSVGANGVVELSVEGTSGTRTVQFSEVLLTTETAPVNLEEEEESGRIDPEVFMSLLQSGGSLASLGELLGSEVQVRVAGGSGELFESDALRGGHLGELLSESDFLRALLTNAVTSDDSSTGEDSKEGRMLGMSAAQGNLKKVKEVLQRNPQLIDNKFLGHTPLHKACHNGQVEVIKHLLENKASMTLQDQQGYAALHHAAYGDYSGAAVRVLAGYGANLNDNSNDCKTTPLDLAVKRKNEAAVRYLIEAGCDVNVQDTVGRVALHVAIDENLENITEILLAAKGISLRKCDRRGLNPFLLAVSKGFLSIVKVMMKRFTKIVTVPEEAHEMTALHFAALCDNVEITKLLLQSEFCDPDARNSSGLTPADLAIAAENFEVVELFRNPSIWSVTQKEKCSSEGDQKSLPSANNNSSAPRKQRVREFQIGDMCRIKNNKNAVEAFQIGHGGWNTLLDMFLGQEGMVVEKLPTGDLKFQLAEIQKELILNPAALEPVIPEESRQTDAATETTSNEATEDASTSQADLLSCLSGTEVCYKDTYNLADGEALFWAVISERYCRVKEILDCNPELVNHCWKGIPILHAACAAQSVELTSLLIEKGVSIDLKDKEGYTALYHATMMNRTGKLAELLLDAGANPCDTENQKKTTPLHLTVTSDNKKMFDRLMEEENCGINMQDVLGNTPVHEAVRYNRGEMLESLLSHSKVELLVTNMEGYTALHIAIIKSNSSFVLKLLHHSPMLATITVQDGVEMGTIHLACSQPDVAILDALLNVQNEEWPDIHRNNNEDLAPLAVANRSNNKSVIRRLLQLYDQEDIQRRKSESEEASSEFCNTGDDVGSSQTKDSAERPLGVGDVVRIRTNEEVVRLLQDGHGPFNKSTITTLGQVGQIMSIAPSEDIEVLVEDKSWTFNPLAVTCVSRAETPDQISTSPDDLEGTEELPNAAEPQPVQQDNKGATSDTGTLEDILDCYPDLANAVSRNTTPLHQACLYGLTTVVAMLLEKGADKDTEDSAGRSPLHVTAAHDKTGATAALLVRHGANTNSNGVPNKRTPLHVAVWRNNEAVAREIMDHDGTDINQQDNQGDTPLLLAVREKKDIFLNIFTASENIQPLIRNNHGFNTLHQAVMSGNINAVKMLVECYPNIVNEATEDGFTSLHIAATHNEYECAEILLSTVGCKTNTRTKNNETPFMLASSSGFTALKELLREPGNEVDDARVDEAVTPNFAESLVPTETVDSLYSQMEASPSEGPVPDLSKILIRDEETKRENLSVDKDADAMKPDPEPGSFISHIRINKEEESEIEEKLKSGDRHSGPYPAKDVGVVGFEGKDTPAENVIQNTAESLMTSPETSLKVNAENLERIESGYTKENRSETTKIEVPKLKQDCQDISSVTYKGKCEEVESIKMMKAETVPVPVEVVRIEPTADEITRIKNEGKQNENEQEKESDEEIEEPKERVEPGEVNQDGDDHYHHHANSDVHEDNVNIDENGGYDEDDDNHDNDGDDDDDNGDTDENEDEDDADADGGIDSNEDEEEEEEVVDEEEEVVDEEEEVVDEEEEREDRDINQTSGDWNDSPDGVKIVKADVENQLGNNKNHPGSSDEWIDLTAGRKDREETSSSCESGEETAKSSKNDNRHDSNSESEDEQQSLGKESLCSLCDRRPNAIMFQPCGHKIVCKGCSTMIKYCFICGSPVAKKIEEGC